MKKKILLFILMFMFITNVSALAFNVDVTNIEDEGNNGTMGSITRIDVPNKTLDSEFSDIGDEVSFSITVTNTGDRAGTLRSIDIISTNDRIEYKTSLPDGGLAINGNDTNKVTVTAKVKEGAVNGTSTSTIKIKYTYDEGSCPEGEILSEDESMCLCPEGKVRNEVGICIEPPKPIECADDEIYNEEKKVCEKKVVPVDPEEPVEPEPTPEPETPDEPKKEDIKPTPITPSNPKTLDNIILITLLFFVSGLGIYAVMFKKLDTNKKKISAGVTLGVVTFTLSFTVLAGVFGIDNLLGAIINPITKSKEIIVTVNEKIEMLETWDGSCSIGAYSGDLTPENIFEGGSGTESDPYQIKTANQLACFALSVNVGSDDYSGKYVKQIKDIKLNDNLIASADNDDFEGIHYWTSIGNQDYYYYFGGTYDGDNHTVSGILLNNYSMNNSSAKGFFGYTNNATIKNLTLSDMYLNVSSNNVGGLVGVADGNTTIKNIKTYGKVAKDDYDELVIPGGRFDYGSNGGIVGKVDGYGFKITIEDCENNISPITAGIIGNVSNTGGSEEPNVVLRNVVNNGDFYSEGGIIAYVSDYNNGGANVLIENAVNNGNYNYAVDQRVAGIIGSAKANKMVIKNSGNTGNLTNSDGTDGAAGIMGSASVNELLIEGCYNSGDIKIAYDDSYANGVTVTELNRLRSASPSNDLGGIIATIYAPATSTPTIKNSYNTGTLAGLATTGGILGYNKSSDDHISSNVLIDNCYNAGPIFVGDGATGGLVGNTKGTVKDSHNTGTITVWGFRDPYSGNGTIHYGTLVGGLVGKGSNYTLTDDVTGANITNSYNEGDIIITAKTDKVSIGGICGACSTITNGHNSGNIISKYAPQSFDGIGFRIFDSATDTYFDGEITTENLTY